MRLLLKILAWFLLAIIAGAVAVAFFLHESKPLGSSPDAADRLARQMMQAVNKTAWDSTRYVHWFFFEQHEYLWDKFTDSVLVRWDDYEVLLHTKTVTGMARKAGQPLEGSRAVDAISKAWEYFCNDSFWLNPVVKAFDPGTRRSLATTRDGRQGLLVEYTAGGVTPGDAYLWLLDQNHRPVAWKMWVKILPIGGLECTWEGWTQLPTGAWVATRHSFFGRSFTFITDLNAGQSLEELGVESLGWE